MRWEEEHSRPGFYAKMENQHLVVNEDEDGCCGVLVRLQGPVVPFQALI